MAGAPLISSSYPPQTSRLNLQPYLVRPIQRQALHLEQGMIPCHLVEVMITVYNIIPHPRPPHQSPCNINSTPWHSNNNLPPRQVCWQPLPGLQRPVVATRSARAKKALLRGRRRSFALFAVTEPADITTMPWPARAAKDSSGEALQKTRNIQTPVNTAVIVKLICTCAANAKSADSANAWWSA